MGTFGTLTMPEFRCYTVERPWLDNEPGVSCIPNGQYEVVPARFYRGDYDAYILIEVPDRELIKMHIANTMDDVHGCIGLGNQLGWVYEKWAVLNSRPTFALFMRMMGGESGHIDIFNKQHVGENFHAISQRAAAPTV